MAYQKMNAIFSSPERKTPGTGGIFSIFVSRPVQGMRGLRDRLRRSQGVEDGAGNRRGERRARNGHRLPESAAGHFAEISGPLQRCESRGLKDRGVAQHADGARATTTRWFPATAPARAAAKRACCAPLLRSPKPTCGRCTTPRATALWPRPANWRRPACKAGGGRRRRIQTNMTLFRQAIAHLVMGLGGEDDKGHQGAHRSLRGRAWRRSPTRNSWTRSPRCC